MKYSVLIALVGVTQAAEFDLNDFNGIDVDVEELEGGNKAACK